MRHKTCLFHGLSSLLMFIFLALNVADDTQNKRRPYKGDRKRSRRSASAIR